LAGWSSLPVCRLLPNRGHARFAALKHITTILATSDTAVMLKLSSTYLTHILYLTGALWDEVVGVRRQLGLVHTTQRTPEHSMKNPKLNMARPVLQVDNPGECTDQLFFSHCILSRYYHWAPTQRTLSNLLAHSLCTRHQRRSHANQHDISPRVISTKVAINHHNSATAPHVVAKPCRPTACVQ
jgi:hypothetical protein